MKWMNRVWALLVLAAAAVLGALLCGHIVDAKQVQTALLLVATTALLVLAGTLAWIEKQLQDILRRLKEQEYTRLLPDEEKNKALPFYPQLWDAVMNQVDMAKESDAAEEYERQATLQALQSQINPHFLFNTINTIASLIRTNPEKARMLLREFAVFYRRTLEDSADLILFAREIEQTLRYFAFEIARFGEDRVAMEVDIEPEVEDMLIPPFLIQPLVENAVRHAMPSEGKLTISIIGRVEARTSS